MDPIEFLFNRIISDKLLVLSDHNRQLSDENAYRQALAAAYIEITDQVETLYDRYLSAIYRQIAASYEIGG